MGDWTVFERRLGERGMTMMMMMMMMRAMMISMMMMKMIMVAKNNYGANDEDCDANDN